MLWPTAIRKGYTTGKIVQWTSNWRQGMVVCASNTDGEDKEVLIIVAWSLHYSGQNESCQLSYPANWQYSIYSGASQLVRDVLWRTQSESGPTK